MSSPHAAAWAAPEGDPLAGAPRFAGTLSRADDDLAAAADDFGHLVHRRPLAVLRPDGAADVAAVVRFGRERGLPVVPRGTGHSIDGQSQVAAGIVVDLASLNAVAEGGPRRVSAGAGALWSQVVDVTLPGALAPPVLPDYLALSVGGTLSAGGISGTSHQHGCIAANVHDLDVVTPAGELVTCSPAHNSDLFDAVRATQGEHGIIVRATLMLSPAAPLVRRYLIEYRDLRPFLADQWRVAADGRFDYVGGQAQLVPGGGFRYTLDAAVMFTPPDAPDDSALLAGLPCDRRTGQVTTVGYREFLDRLLPFERQLRRSGSWQHHAHPRCNVLLPGRHAEEIISAVLGELTPENLGSSFGGNIMLYPIPTAKLSPPHMPKARDPITVVFGVQRTTPPGDPGLLSEILLANALLRERAAAAGGTTYAYPGQKSKPR